MSKHVCTWCGKSVVSADAVTVHDAARIKHYFHKRKCWTEHVGFMVRKPDAGS